MKFKNASWIVVTVCVAKVAFTAQHEIEFRLAGTPELLNHVPIVQFSMNYDDGYVAAGGFSTEEIRLRKKRFFFQADRGRPQHCSFAMIIDFKQEWLLPLGFTGPINSDFNCPMTGADFVAIDSRYNLSNLSITVMPSSFEARTARALAWNITSLESSGDVGPKKGGAMINSGLTRQIVIQVLHRGPVRYRLSLKWILRGEASKYESYDLSTNDITVP